ncbi:MAG: putative sulfate/molybdate transporter [Dehalococcoidia bacterium]|nr:putative sulfate/molybdate transporter [Dehalococcoidia bacterium]
MSVVAPVACPPDADGVPHGVRLVREHETRLERLAVVPVRCRSQAADAAPRYARPRFAWNVREVSGALGDLGTFLPHVLAAITVAGMPATGVLFSFGLFYMSSGAFFGIPLGVQPMKAASAALLTQGVSPAQVSAAGIVLGATFLLAGATGLIDVIARRVPGSVSGGIQVGLGLLLARLGLKEVSTSWWIGVSVLALVVVLLAQRRLPAALIGVSFGLLLAAASGRLHGVALHPGVHAPALVRPDVRDFVRGSLLLALPQLPLTLTNAIIVTAALARQLFPKEVHVVNERNLSLSTGLANLVLAPFGGYPMCHGAGGLAGHYRFGARSAAAPLLIGATFLLLAVVFGGSAAAILTLVPLAAVGALLAVSGVELVSAAHLQEMRRPDLVVCLSVAALTYLLNPAAAFVAGLVGAACVDRLARVSMRPAGPGP